MDESDQFLRQIHPSFIDRGNVTSQAFRPTPKDSNRLSGYDGTMITPAASHEHYTKQQKLVSSGVLGVTVAECKEHGVEPEADPEPFKEHVVIDFSRLGNREKEKVGKNLRNKAESRGWLFQPPA